MILTILQQIAGIVSLIVASRLDRKKELKRQATVMRVVGFAMFIFALSFSHLRDGVAIFGYLAALHGNYDIAATVLAIYHTLAMGDSTTAPFMVMIRAGLAMASLLGISVTTMF